MSGWNRAFFLLCGVAACYALTGREQHTRPLGKGQRRWLLTAVVLLAVGVRLWRFGAVPGGINQDGAMAAVDAKALADYGTDRFGMVYPVYFTAWGYGQMSVMMSYLMAPLIRLFGMNVYTLRLPCLLCSLLGLACLYLLARRAWGEGSALTLLFFAAIDPWHVMQSRWALDCNLYPHFLLAGVYLLHRGAEGGRKWLYSSMLLFGLSMYCYGIAAYTTPLFLLLACAALLRRRKVTWGQAGGCAALFLAVAWPFFAVLVINTFRLPTLATPLFTMARFPYTVRSSDLLFFSENIPAQLAANAKNALRLILLQGKDLAWNDIEGFGTLYLFSLPLTALGAWTLWQRREESGSALILLLFFTGVLNALLVRDANINRANVLFYPMVIFTGMGLHRAMRALHRGGAALPVLYLLAFALFCRSYFGVWNQQISRHFLSDFGEAVSAVENVEAECWCITQNTQYTTAYRVSEILTLYYHNVDAAFFQSEAYPQRYRYGADGDWPLEGVDAAYVIRSEEGARFAEAGYRVEYYGRFATAIKAPGT